MRSGPRGLMGWVNTTPMGRSIAQPGQWTRAKCVLLPSLYLKPEMHVGKIVPTFLMCDSPPHLRKVDHSRRRRRPCRPRRSPSPCKGC